MAKRLRKRVSKKTRTSQSEEEEKHDENTGEVKFSEPKGQETESSAKDTAKPAAKNVLIQESATPEPDKEEPSLSESNADLKAAELEVPGESKKRKRTRKRKRSHIPHPGPDPETIEGLSDSARKAIAYTQQYLRDKDSWKFSKPRQNWILRHTLWSPRLFEIGQQLSQAAQDMLDESVKQTLPPILPMPELGSWIIDEHISVTAAYLVSIMGHAKQRMLEALKAAIEPPAIVSTEAPEHEKTEETMAKPEKQQATENTEKDSEAPSLAETWLSLRKERATQLLEWIHALEST